METWEILEKALGLIENEENWCQRGAGDGVNEFCAMHAVHAAGGRYGDVLESPAWKALSELVLDGHPMFFNLTHSHAEVCDLFKRAIAKAKADAGIYLEVPTRERVEA